MIKYLVIGKKEEFETIIYEIEKKSKGKIIFGDFLNPSPEAFLEKIKYHDRVLIADPNLEHYVKKELESLKKQGIVIEILPELVEKYLQRIPLSVFEKFEYYYSEFFLKKEEKRFFDIFLALFFLIFSLPLFIIISIINYFTIGKPVIFKQIRMGKNKKKFLMYKFRTIHNDNIHSFGKFLRKTRLDEIPQFINVLIGNMNFIGPRPEMLTFHQMCEENIDFYNYRLYVNPGITGWAQVKYKYTTTLEDYKIKTEYDLYYVKNKNYLLDLKIIFLTFLTIFKDNGSL
ncbi:Sugar transferase involved in LPS biosynthesis (colanic, teichoic acid) [Marinitoga hydrogenitolerans DSM 16785]|uniref:Sugar transferase involved in LPS biosynthesis (Colanic, teichoic acid) n=1 Tax=Marinitoga hydrogenitolerans (strain DSM 16785 / JCM 12826 / AT1271) TaxID=1122195 RepID=A0A1M4TW44_MARH1|nr:sugar transferase [Marinitoga hydrogenitolerans]SHE48701.1 Sugar transferase involved in LPS biosynthesis (colanic, teichoic acid) [Marinitoga hydrogenitolerans DSM 16785]